MIQDKVFYMGTYYLVCGFTSTYAEISTGGPQNLCVSNMYYKR